MRIGLLALALLASHPTQGNAEHQQQTAEVEQPKPAEQIRPSTQLPTPTTFNLPRAETDTEKADHAGEDTHRDRSTAAEWAMVRLTGVLVGANIVYVIAAILQWFAIRRQADLAERAITELERPWILVQPQSNFSGFEVSSPQESIIANHMPMGTVLPYAVANHGRTPAWLIGRNVQLVVLPKPLPDEPAPLIVEETPPVPLPPMGDKPRIHRVTGTATPDERHSLIQGRAIIVFYGCVRYRDVFGHEHESRFCFLGERAPNWLGGPRMMWLPGPPRWTSYT